MAKCFSINELEKFSGIKAHTIRIWEHRYAILQPLRKTNNARCYSLDELIHLLQIALLNRNGYKISKLSAFSYQQIQEKLNSFTDDESLQQQAVIKMIHQMYLLNIGAFEQVLDLSLSVWPYSEVLSEVIYPFLKFTNLLWQGKRLTEEHLVVTILRKKIMYAIEKIPSVNKKNKTVLLFLADTRQLDLALLYACYSLKSAGMEVIYLGNDVTLDNLSTVCEKVNPDYLYTYLQMNSTSVQLLKKIDEQIPDSKTIVTIQPGQQTDFSINGNISSMRFNEAIGFLSQQSEKN